MTNWKETTLDEIATITMGQSPLSESYNLIGDGLPFYQGVTEFGDKYIGIKSYTNSPTKILDAGSILFSVRAPVGQVNITKNKCCIGRGNAGLVMKNGEQEFLYYLLTHLEKNILKNTTGTVFDSISGVELRKFPVLIPESKEEQKEIAGVLSSLDDKIELLQEENKTLEATAQAIFKEWFVNFNFPGATDKMIDSELGEIPEEWRIGRLSDVADITIGRTPPRKESEWFSTDSNDVKWISIKDMGNCGVYTGDTAEYLTRDAVERFNIPVIPKNTAVVSFKMTVGRVSITVEEMLSNEAIAHIKLKKDGLTVEYIYLFLKNFNFSDLGSTSSIVNATNSTAIKNLSVLIPEKNIIDEFDSAVGSVFQKILTNSEQIQTLSTLRDTLLPKLMSGDLRIK